MGPRLNKWGRLCSGSRECLCSPKDKDAARTLYRASYFHWDFDLLRTWAISRTCCFAWACQSHLCRRPCLCSYWVGRCWRPCLCCHGMADRTRCTTHPRRQQNRCPYPSTRAKSNKVNSKHSQKEEKYWQTKSGTAFWRKLLSSLYFFWFSWSIYSVIHFLGSKTHPDLY